MGEIKKVRRKYQKIVRKQEHILKIFIMQENQLLIFLMSIRQEHLKLEVKQKKEQDLK